MNRFASSTILAAVALVAVGCDKQGIYPYGRRTDVIVSCGDPASVYLRSTETGSDIFIVGNTNPTTVIGAGSRRCMLVGTVDRDSSTTLFYGAYDLDASGRGEYYVDSKYYFPYEPNVNIGGRAGAQRQDFDSTLIYYHDPIEFSLVGDKLTIDYANDVDGEVDYTGVYTAFDSVVAAVDLNDPEGPTDLYQIYNFALFFSQVRVPAFGSIGMTRYITSPGHFDGLISGAFSISVDSIGMPWATMSYSNLQDFPRVTVSGSQVTKANLQGSGPMAGALSFSITETADPAHVVYAGNVDYGNVTVTNGVASSGTYTVNVTSPVTISAEVPYTVANDVDLRHVLPIEP